MPYTNPEKQRIYQRNWVAERKLAYFKNKCCVRCGSTENLELDHINPERKVSHKIWSWSKVKREAELEKCQVLCSLHHLGKTSRFRRLKIVHGTRGKYDLGCRCKLCTIAKREHNKKYK